MRPLGRANASTRTQAHPRGPVLFHTPAPRPPRTPLLALPQGRAAASTRKNKQINFNFLIFWVVSCWKREEKKCSVFYPQDLQAPRAPRASRAKPQEEKGFFGLVPLVTHPSSIPLLGGLTPKFLSLSFHSLQGLLMLMASRVGTLWSLGNLIDLELNLCSIESNEGVTTNIIIIAP
jgi:hypothetical protein